MDDPSTPRYGWTIRPSTHMNERPIHPSKMFRNNCKRFVSLHVLKYFRISSNTLACIGLCDHLFKYLQLSLIIREHIRTCSDISKWYSPFLNICKDLKTSGFFGTLSKSNSGSSIHMSGWMGCPSVWMMDGSSIHLHMSGCHMDSIILDAHAYYLVFVDTVSS